MLNELRHALRMLARRPAFSLLAVVTLALGIGANTAMFTVVHGVLLKPLPYTNPERIVRVWEQTERGSRAAVSNPNFLDWRDRSRSFDTMAAYAGGPQTVLGGTEPVFAPVYAVTDGFFRVFGVAPMAGRTFVSEEMRRNGTPAVVVSHGFWRRVLGSNPDLSAVPLRVAGMSCRVVGVMPPGFAYPANAEVWIPKELTEDATRRTAHNLSVVARLGEGATLAKAAPEMNTLAAVLQREHAGNNDATGVAIVPLRDALTGTAREPLLMLWAAVALVLLIACANVASMLLAQGEGRRVELAVRSALGAGRGRIVRQLFAENLLLSVLGAACGLAMTSWLVGAVRAIPGVPLPRADALGIDRTILLFTVLLAVVTPLLIGILPALQMSRANLRDMLAQGGRGAASAARARVRSVLIAGEVAVALLLLVGSALLIRSFQNVMAVDAGFDPRGVLAAEMSVPAAKYDDPLRAAAFYEELLAQLRALPGVSAAGVVNQLPLGGIDFGGGFRFEGDSGVQNAGYRLASEGYFESLGIGLRRGRLFDGRDSAGRPPVALVNEAFVRQYLSGQDPLGKRFAFLGMDRVNPMLTIVGVVADVRHRGLVTQAAPEVFLSYRQQPSRTRWTMNVVVKAERPDLAESLASAVRERVRAVDADVPVRFRTLNDMVAMSVADRRFTLFVLTAFAVIALALAAAGIYGVLAHAVSQRTQEIGIRMALGAQPRAVVRLLLRSGLAPVGIGIAAGVAGALAGTRALTAFLFGVAPHDPVALTWAVAVLSAAAALGAFVPARRAVRVDPLIALKR